MRMAFPFPFVPWLASSRDSGPSSIRRVDLKRVVTIDGDVVRAQGRTEDSVRQEVAARLESLDWPAGYRWEFAGSNQDEQEARAFVQRAFVIAVLLIMLVLVTQFDSLILPMTIMVSVVLSLIGVLWGLIITADAVWHHHDRHRCDLPGRRRREQRDRAL